MGMKVPLTAPLPHWGRGDFKSNDSWRAGGKGQELLIDLVEEKEGDAFPLGVMAPV